VCTSAHGLAFLKGSESMSPPPREINILRLNLLMILLKFVDIKEQLVQQ